MSSNEHSVCLKTTDSAAFGETRLLNEWRRVWKSADKSGPGVELALSARYNVDI